MSLTWSIGIHRWPQCEWPYLPSYGIQLPNSPQWCQQCYPLRAPVTPTDPTLGQIRLPVISITPVPPPTTATAVQYKTLQQQFCSVLPLWKHVLYRSLHKAHSTNTLYQKLTTMMLIMIVSNASVQNDGQSGFAWVIAHDAAPLWRGMGLTPGPEVDMYSG